MSEHATTQNVSATERAGSMKGEPIAHRHGVNSI